MKRNIFISFAEPDRAIAEALTKFIKLELKFSVFYSHERLPKTGQDDWIACIRKAISECQCFVSVVTQNYINRSWPLYEAGMADALGKTFCRIKAANISHKWIRQHYPGPDRFTNEIRTIDDLCDFATRLYEITDQKKSNKNLHGKISKSDLALKVVKLFSKRKIFISGSIYQGNTRIRPVIIKSNTTIKDRQQILEFVTRDITRALLARDFMMCCYPYVSVVGKTVAETVQKWCKRNDKNWYDYFSITPVSGSDEKYDDERSLAEQSGSVGEMIELAFRHERGRFIREQEWVIALGGNKRTKTECELAVESPGVRLCPLPIFDGAAYDFWKKEQQGSPLPVSDQDREWDDEVRDRLIDFICDEQNQRNLS